MLVAAFAVLAVAVVIGSALAVLRLHHAPPPPWPAAALHGAVAIAGLAVLLLALRGPPRGLATGTAEFGAAAAVLLALAALTGAATTATRGVARRAAGPLTALHAGLAITGLVILAAYLLAG